MRSIVERQLSCFVILLSLSTALVAQPQFAAAEDTVDTIPAEELPLAVIWGLSLYSGAVIPYAPDPLVEFWNPGLNVTVDMDILLRNDLVLGLSFSYSKLGFDEAEFWRAQGVDNSGDLGSEFDIPISSLLLSFRGKEDYLVNRLEPSWEIGGGIYSIENSDLDKIYISDYNYVLRTSNRPEFGVFGGFRLARLMTETMQFSIRARYHYVFKLSRHHQFFDVCLGVSLL